MEQGSRDGAHLNLNVAVFISKKSASSPHIMVFISCNFSHLNNVKVAKIKIRKLYSGSSLSYKSTNI